MLSSISCYKISCRFAQTITAHNLFLNACRCSSTFSDTARYFADPSQINVLFDQKTSMSFAEGGNYIAFGRHIRDLLWPRANQTNQGAHIATDQWFSDRSEIC